MNEHLLAPAQFVSHTGMLIVCVENQSCAYWGLSMESVAQADPPVWVANAGPEMSVWEIASNLEWQVNHQHVSAFLDDLTYSHAFARGALFGAKSGRLRPEPWQAEWLERNWRQAAVKGLRWGDITVDAWLGSPLYVREGRALQWYDRFYAVADSARVLDEVAQALGIHWEEHW